MPVANFSRGTRLKLLLPSKCFPAMAFWRRRSVLEPDYRQTLHDFSRSLSLIVDPEELYAAVAAWLRETFGLQSVAIFLRSSDSTSFRIAAARGIDEATALAAAIDGDGRLARWLRVNEELLLLGESPGVAIFMEDERLVLERLGIVACVPLVAMNRLTGFLAIGSRGQDELGLQQLERDLLKAVAPQAALAFENAALIREQRARLKRLYRAERLATAGELAAGAAHEIRNPLASIRSAIQYLRSDYKDRSDRGALIDEVLAEADRIDGIVEGLLSFARPQEVHFETVDLAELVRQSASLIAARAQSQGVCHTIDVPESLRLAADRSLLKQLLLNILLNALQAMPENGKLQIVASEKGKMAMIRVMDTGSGIAPEHLERVFDPFFTTKKEGTGLGLSISYGIVELHGGEIDIESQVGQGTVTTIRLPTKATGEQPHPGR